MKIIHVLWSLGRGGAERFVLDLATEQQKEHEVCIVAICGGDMQALFTDQGLEVIVLGKQRQRTFSDC